MGFWEILVIIIVGLLVVGPERLPEAIRGGMLWFGKAKRTINDTRAEFEQQLGIDEIRRELHNEQVLKSLKAMEDAAKNVNAEALDISGQIHTEINSIGDAISHVDASDDAPESLSATDMPLADSSPTSPHTEPAKQNDPIENK